MATGPAGSAYAEYGARYRERLARSGIQLTLVPTEGAVANLALLRDAVSGVGAGFVQAGTTTAAESPGLVSLGTVFYEPLWLFERGLDPKAGFAALAGRRISIGREGSGTRALALRILDLGGVGAGVAELMALSPEEAADRLEGGTIDAAAIVTSWESPVVRRLLMAPGITLASLPRADAHVALQPHLTKLVLPAGVADLGRNLPPADVMLVAPKASLAVRRDLHPALQYLLLDAADQIHAAPGVFHRASEFPAAEAIDLPLADDALQFHKAGRPFLQRHLPFWLAVQGQYAEAAEVYARAGPLLDTQANAPGEGAHACSAATPALLRTYRAMGRTDEAQSLATRCLEVLRRRYEDEEGTPRDTDTAFALAALAANEGYKDEAVRALDNNIERKPLEPFFDPRLPWYRNLAGHPGYADYLAERQRRMEQARAEMESIQEQFPNSVIVRMIRTGQPP